MSNENRVELSAEGAQTQAAIQSAMAERILILDGAMGTKIQMLGLTEADYRGERFADWPSDLKGNNDLLCLTAPARIARIHDEYFEAGADIILTNTFNANAMSQSDYDMQALSYELNVAAGQLARASADKFSTPERPRWACGSLGPMNVTLSLSPDVSDPAYRKVTFPVVRDAYKEAARGLLEGGVHLLVVETIFDTLNCKAALVGIQELFQERGERVPVMISVTVPDQSGRTLNGQTVEAFWHAVRHVEPLSVGLNCALGAAEMRPWIQELSRVAECPVTCYPNAGLPNAFGEYDETPAITGQLIAEFADEGWLNMAGGCCGTTPPHIAAIAAALEGKAPRVPPAMHDLTRLAGLEPLTIRPETGFLMVGERTNVTGSARFRRLIKEEDYETALQVARNQVEGGANILDVNMDEGLLDSEAVMGIFLRLIASEPEIARIPVMVDSSKWSVIETGIQELSGKGVVNSISLKEGEAEFKERAWLCKRYGAAMVVMAFDENGQATGFEDRIRILSRAHKILTEEVGVDEADIIFDSNILTIATGMEEHADYAVHFIEACRELKRRFPRAHLIGGVSNLSFGFRGNPAVREALHAVFLYHAIAAGLDMGIVNAGQLTVYEDVPADLRELCEDVVFNKRADATERLVEYAERIRAAGGGKGKKRVRDDSWREADLSGRLAHALRHGVVDFMDVDMAEALENYDRPLHIIEGPLMDGMNIVGDLFGSGRMFLPQVVKSARAMKKAVAILQPHIEAEKAEMGVEDDGKGAGTVLLATVKGDVHDIGKNIVGVVLGCNGYVVHDLGVMVSADKILKTAREIDADIIGLSGLITPSLDEMVYVAQQMKRQGFETPLLIGGATTSSRHTAVKIAPQYDGLTVHVLDASRAPGVLSQLLSEEKAADFATALAEKHEKERARHAKRRTAPLLSHADAKANRGTWDWSTVDVQTPTFTGVIELTSAEVPLSTLADWIDWTPLFSAWELRGAYPAILDHPEMGEEARKLYASAREMLDGFIESGSLEPRGVYGFFPAASDGDDIVVYEDASRTRETCRFNMLRQQHKKPGDEQANLCLSDFVAPVGSGVADHIGAFAVTTGHGIEKIVAAYKADHDDYHAIMAKLVADRLAEAFAEYLHKRARDEWGFGRDEGLSLDEMLKEKYRGIRPAFGYPACPDHLEKETLFALLGAEEAAGIQLTESMAMLPAAAVSGIFIGHPASHYFTIKQIGEDQLGDLAARKGIDVETLRRWLAPVLP